MLKKTNILFLISLLFFTSCEKAFDYSPYVINFHEENKDQNSKNIKRIQKKENTDSTVRIVLTGDTHRCFDELELFVEATNLLQKEKDIDFVIHVGDLADFGLPKQYLWGHSYLQKLNMPYIVTLGNHDLVGNGGQAYEQMFGESDFSFVYHQFKFIFINTNSREYAFNGKVPDINWLDNQLQPQSNFQKAVVIFHVPPMDVDFDSHLEESFHNTLSKYNNVLLAIHGHLHHYDLYKPYADSIQYLNVYSLERMKFNSLTISPNQIIIDSHEI